MTIYSREVIDEEVKEECSACGFYIGNRGITVLVDNIEEGCTYATNPVFNYCPECGRKLK